MTLALRPVFEAIKLRRRGELSTNTVGSQPIRRNARNKINSTSAPQPTIAKRGEFLKVLKMVVLILKPMLLISKHDGAHIRAVCDSLLGRFETFDRSQVAFPRPQ